MRASDSKALGRPTMADVAREVGVSIKTVSRVVNQDPHVSPETATRITAAIQRLGFRRNENARQLRQGTAATIGLLLEDISDPFYSQLTRAVEETLLGFGYMLYIASSAENPERADRLIASFFARGVDGLIITPADGIDRELLRTGYENGCPIVLVDRPVQDLAIDAVLVDNRGGVRDATRHLIGAGHRRIAFFGDMDAVYTARERCAGYHDALREAGILVDPDLVIQARPDAVMAQSVWARLASCAEPVTAVIAGNNRWSVTLLRLLYHDERAVAFVGFDELELGDVVRPGITVVDQNPSATGRVAADLLIRRIMGDPSPTQQVQLTTRIVQRGSGEVSGPFADVRGGFRRPELTTSV